MPGEAAGKTIRIDRDAAGLGWFVDPTPNDDTEFADRMDAHTLAARQGTAADCRAELLTTVMHEMGPSLNEYTDAGDLMASTLSLGVRRADLADQVFAAFQIS